MYRNMDIVFLLAGQQATPVTMNLPAKHVKTLR